MSTFNKFCVRRSVLLAVLLGLTVIAKAQTYPIKPVHIVVGYSAGGGVDAMARLLAPYLATQLGQPVVVENRAGAAGLIAGEAVAKAAPNGYTLLLGESAMLIAPYLQSNLSFDPIKSFVPVAGLFNSPLMIVAGNEVTAKNAKELILMLKANPGKYSYASSGVGTVQHLGFEMFKRQTGAFVVHVPYRGAAQILPDVIGGQIPLGVVSATSAIAQTKAGKLVPIAMMSSVNLPGAENVAPLSDTLPGFSVAPRLMLLAPVGTPAGVVERLSEAVRVSLSNPIVMKSANALGAIPAFLSSAELAIDLTRESAGWAKIIKDQKISGQ